VWGWKPKSRAHSSDLSSVALGRVSFIYVDNVDVLFYSILFYSILIYSRPHAVVTLSAASEADEGGVPRRRVAQRRCIATTRAAFGLCFVDVNELHHLLWKCGRI